MWIADTARSRELDRTARESYGIPTRVLMERAGKAVFEAIHEAAPGARRVAVICGKGHNGGDGVVVAREARREGLDVKLLFATPERDLCEATAEQLGTARAEGLAAVFADEPSYPDALDSLGCRDVIVDALLGIGAKGAAQGVVLDAIQAINRSGVPVVAIDVPSGIECDSGDELGDSVWAARTVTLGLPKPFLFQGIGLEHSGYWSVSDIGIPQDLRDEPTEARLIDCRWVGQLLPERLRASHKGENGSILIVAGSRRMPGAAVLAARAALRAGAGLVTVASVEAVCDAVAAHVPEALLLPLPETGGIISADAAGILLDRQSMHHGALFGPGLTHEHQVLALLERCWAEWHVPTCIDADALNAMAQGVPPPETECVLTPHAGEMSRLLQCSAAEVQLDRFSTIRQAIAAFPRAILLKGPYSIVGEQHQPLLVNCTGNPGMASGGMGDVLGGVVATLLGQDLPGYYAAGCGMYWHGMAGDLCAVDIGPIGYTAMDVANHLPRARTKITQECDFEGPCC